MRSSVSKAASVAIALSLATAAGAEPGDEDDRVYPGPGSGPPLTIVLVGDTGFAPSNARVDPRGVREHGRLQPWGEAVAAIAADIDGDLNFANVETVVTPRNDLPGAAKGDGVQFHFKSHPEGFRRLAEAGFNLFSLANNHAMDYGAAGLRETLKAMDALAGRRTLVHAGAGRSRDEATRPALIEVGGVRVAFSAVGIGPGRAGPDRPGQASFHSREDFDAVTRRLGAANAGYRILSSHYGPEGRVRTGAKQIEAYRTLAAGKAGIDLVAGHHAHVVQPVEIAGTSIIFYGLGNFLHHGTADMSRFGLCRDYGLLARVHLARDAAGVLAARAIEAVPLTRTHIRPQRFSDTGRSHQRIYALNYLGGLLRGSGAGGHGVRFTPQADGSGLYCFAGAQDYPGRIGRLCRNWKPAGPVPAALRGRIAASCRPRAFYRQPAKKKPGGFFSLFRGLD